MVWLEILPTYLGTLQTLDTMEKYQGRTGKVPGVDIPLTSYELLFFFWKKQNKNIFYTSDDECKKNICH